MPTRKKTHSKIIATKLHENVKSGNAKKVHEFREKTVVNFIYYFFFVGYFCFVSFIVNFTFFALESSRKLERKCSFIFLIASSGSKVKLILNLLILGAFLGPYHRHLLSLSNESMTSKAYPKLYEFERILYTTHSINREKDGYNLTFNFFNTSFYSTHINFNLYIFVTGKKDFDLKVGDGTNNFTIHYPQVSRQKGEDPAYFY